MDNEKTLILQLINACIRYNEEILERFEKIEASINKNIELIKEAKEINNKIING